MNDVVPATMADIQHFGIRQGALTGQRIRTRPAQAAEALFDAAASSHFDYAGAQSFYRCLQLRKSGEHCPEWLETVRDQLVYAETKGL